jgi:hypothetical protein
MKKGKRKKNKTEECKELHAVSMPLQLRLKAHPKVCAWCPKKQKTSQTNH